MIVHISPHAASLGDKVIHRNSSGVLRSRTITKRTAKRIVVAGMAFDNDGKPAVLANIHKGVGELLEPSKEVLADLLSQIQKRKREEEDREAHIQQRADDKKAWMKDSVEEIHSLMKKGKKKKAVKLFDQLCFEWQDF